MTFTNLSEFIQALEKNGELIRIQASVDPVLEIAEICDRVSKQKGGGKALLFENTGTQFPVLINAYGSYNRICTALGINQLDEVGQQLITIIKPFSASNISIWEKLKLIPRLKSISSWMPKVLNRKPKHHCQEVVIQPADLSLLPILKCWPFDGGRFITLPMVITKDPHTGTRNVGMYRMQVYANDLTAMHWHRHKVGARHYQAYKEMKLKMPVSVVLGGDPVYTYCATAPLPDNIDEFMFAGFLRKRSVELIRCITNELEVPVDADIVIEGYIDTQEDLINEGPFGDHTGFYSLPDWFPRFHVTCITHRHNAVYPTTIVGIPPQEDAYLAKATERIFLTPIKMALIPELTDMNMPVVGVAHNITIVKIKSTYPGQALKVMNALWGAGQMMFNKVLVVVDDRYNVHDYKSLAQNVLSRFDPLTDLHFSSGPLDELDHAADKPAFGSKMCFDCTDKSDAQAATNPLQEINAEAHDDYQTVKSFLRKKYTGLTDINFSLEKISIPVAIISIEKNIFTLSNSETGNFAAAITKLVSEKCFEPIKILLVLDSNADILDIETVVWICANNIAPKRDTIIVKHTSISGSASLVIDGTRKNTINGQFTRDWPNVVVSNDETIDLVNKRWNEFQLGAFIDSPSLRYKKYVVNDGAIANPI